MKNIIKKINPNRKTTAPLQVEMSSIKKNNTHDFPTDIQLEIFSKIPNPEKLVTLSRVSKTWKKFSEINALWQKFGFLSKQDFLEKVQHYKQWQLEATDNVYQKIIKHRTPNIYLMGDPDYQNKLFGQDDEPIVFDEIGLIGDRNLRKVKVSEVVLGLIQLSENTILPSNARDIALVTIKNEKEREYYLNQFIEKRGILLIFVIPEADRKQFSKIPQNAIIWQEEPLSTFYEKLLNKINDLPRITHNQHKSCVIC